VEVDRDMHKRQHAVESRGFGEERKGCIQSASERKLGKEQLQEVHMGGAFPVLGRDTAACHKIELLQAAEPTMEHSQCGEMEC